MKGLTIQVSGRPPCSGGATEAAERHVQERIQWWIVDEHGEQKVGDHLDDLPRTPSDEADDRARHQCPATGNKERQYAAMLGELRGQGHEGEGRQEMGQVVVKDPLVEEAEGHARQVEQEAHDQRYANEAGQLLPPKYKILPVYAQCGWSTAIDLQDITRLSLGQTERRYLVRRARLVGRG